MPQTVQRCRASIDCYLKWLLILQSTYEGEVVFYVVCCKNQVTRGRRHRAGFGAGGVSPAERNCPPENRPRSKSDNSPYSWNPQSVLPISDFTPEPTAFVTDYLCYISARPYQSFQPSVLELNVVGDAKQQLAYTSPTLQSGLAVRKTRINDLESSPTGKEVTEVAILPRILRLSVERIRRVASGAHSPLFGCLVVCVVRSFSPDCGICRLRRSCVTASGPVGLQYCMGLIHKPNWLQSCSYTLYIVCPYPIIKYSLRDDIV